MLRINDMKGVRFMSLKEMRKAKGLTQKEAAELFGLKHRTYQNYENGVTSPDMETAARFAQYFSCTIGELFNLEEGTIDALTEEEKALVALYRSLNQESRNALIVTAKGLAGEIKAI